MRIIVEFEVENEEEYNELWSELSNFDGYVTCHKKLNKTTRD